MRLWPVITLILLAGIVGGIPYVAGEVAEQRFRTSMAALTEQAQGTCTLSYDYRRGWISSWFDIECLLDPSVAPDVDLDGVTLRGDGRIDHGPLGGVPGRLPPVAARIDSEITVAGLPMELPKLLVDGVVELDGTVAAELRLDAFEIRDPNVGSFIRVEEGRGRLRVERATGIKEIRLDLPAIDVELEDATRLHVRAIHVEQTTRPWILGLEIGSALVSVEVLRIDTADEFVSSRGLTAEIKSEADDGLFNAVAHYSADSIQIQGESYAPSSITVSARRLDGQSLAQMQQGLDDLMDNEVPEEMMGLAVLSVLVTQLPGLTPRDPEIGIDALQIQTPEGPVTGRLVLGTKGVTQQSVDNPLALLDHVRGTADLSMPRQMAVRLLGLRIREELVVDPQDQGQPRPVLSAQTQERIEGMAQQQIQALIQQGWITERGERLESAAILGDGLLTINGKTLPIGDFGGFVQ